MNNALIYSSIVLFSIITIILMLFPVLDLQFADLFYDHSKRAFIYSDNFWVVGIYLSIPIITKLFAIFCLLNLITLYLKLTSRSFIQKTKIVLSSWYCYLIISILIGPGLIVNYAFKESFNRARPVEIKYFNGQQDFTGAFRIGTQFGNGSFSSGHAAMGYYLTVLAYVPSKKKDDKATKNNFFAIKYIIFLFFGTLVGFSRILMGRHFLSDVTTSCAVILIINHLLYLSWKRLNVV